MIKYFSLFILFPLCVCAQQPVAHGDSATFALRTPIVITGTRFTTLRDAAPSAVYSFSEDQIALNGNSLGALLKLAPGSSLSEYGARGSLNLFSMRGLGPEYTVVYLNGMRLNDAQSGLMDLSRVALLGAEYIEVAPGGFSSLYGSDAVGGVVSIRSTSNEPFAQISGGVGSFHQNVFSAKGNLLLPLGSMRFSFRSERGKNDYPFFYQHEIPERKMTRENADFSHRALSFDGSIPFSSTQINYFASYHTSEVGVPGALTGSSQGKARQSDDAIRAMIGWRELLSPTAFLLLQTSYTQNDERYLDPMIVTNGRQLDSRHVNRCPSISLTYDHAHSSRFHFTGGAEWSMPSLESDEMTSTPRRNSAAIFYSAEYAIERDSSVNDLLTMIRFFPSLRADFIKEDLSGKSYSFFSPSIGINIALVPQHVNLRSRISRSFRAPTFNQLYWKIGGNPNLEPEYSIAWECGVSARDANQFASLDLTYFHHDITDKIVWMPGAGLFWSPKNIQNVVSRGIEASLSFRMREPQMELMLNGQWLDTRKVNASFAGDATMNKRLPYVAPFSGNVALTMKHQRFRLSLIEQITGERFMDEMNSTTLPAVAVTNASLDFEITFNPLRASLLLELKNLFNAQYEMIAFYPMPSRSINATLSLTYH